MIKLLGCRFEQCLVPFTMFLVDGTSQTWLFRHLPNHVFGNCNLGNTKSMSVIFCFKIVKFKLEFKNEQKIWEKGFCLWGNCISTGIVKLTLLRTGYLSLAPNMLANSPNTWHVNKRYFFQLHSLALITKCHKCAMVQISTAIGPVYHVACLWVLWKGTS